MAQMRKRPGEGGWERTGFWEAEKDFRKAEDQAQFYALHSEPSQAPYDRAHVIIPVPQVQQLRHKLAG